MIDFNKLKVWELSHSLTLHVYRLTDGFPKHETYGLASQMRRSSSAIPTNIAEGCGRGSKGELANFLQIARGSASELEYQLRLAKDLGFVSEGDQTEITASVREVQRMLGAYRTKVLESRARMGDRPKIRAKLSDG